MNRKFIQFIVIGILFSLLCQKSFGQFYSLGGDPAKTKWMQISTENYTVIFPKEIDSLARKYASLLENNRKKVLESLDINPKKIPVVLHPYTTKSNGVVSWAPSRMELFTSPDPYDCSSEPWDNHLTLHETRHVGQTYHFAQGGFKPLTYIFGEQITGLGVGLYPCNYFLEGDAVITETQWTNSGRGREADFLMYYRTAFLNGDYRNWDRWRFGSYKDFAPNHYAFGYLINSTLRYKTANYLYPGKVLHYMSEHFYDPSVLAKAYKKNVGEKREAYFFEAVDMMTHIWKKDHDLRGKFTPFTQISTKKEKRYCEYLSPTYIFLPDSKYHKSYIAIKWGYENYRKMVCIDSLGKERTIRPFNYYASPLSYGGKRIYWSEAVQADADNLQDYSNIRYLDLLTGETKTLTRKTKYFNPSVSLSGDTVAVSEYPLTGSSFLVLLDAETGDILLRAKTPFNGQIKESAFAPDGIYCSVITENGLGIFKFADGKWEQEVREQFRSIRHLKAHKHFLYFQSDLDGISNIYCYDTSSKLLRRVVNSEYGTSTPFFDTENGNLLYSSFHPLGYTIASTPLDSLDWAIASFSEPYINPVANALSFQVSKQSETIRDTSFTDVSNAELFPSTKYNKFSHLFRFHSWAPLYYNVDNIMKMSYESFYDLAAVGATLYSQNTLGTAVTMLGYSYHDHHHAGHFKFTYSGFDPIIEIAADLNDRDAFNYDIVPVIGGGAKVAQYSTDKPLLKTSILTYWSLALNSGGWYRAFIPQLSWIFTNDSFYSYQKGGYVFKNQLNYGLRYYQVLPTPTSAIFPRWGFGVSAMWGYSPATKDCFGSTSSFSSYFYLPGITRQQGIKLTAAFQKQSVDGKFFYLTSFVPLPRGYENAYYNKLFKATIDYAIPVHLGDFSLSWLFYMNRMQIIPFADFAMAKNNSGATSLLYSYGIDLLFDFIPFRLNIPVSAGVRYARTGDPLTNGNYFKFLFNISIPQ